MALAMEGTPYTPCGMARLLIETDDGLVSILTPQGATSDGMTRGKFCDRANEGFATWLSPRKEGVEVQGDWYALYLRGELADAVGGFNEALGFSLRSIEEQADDAERFVPIPGKLEEMRERGWVIILGTNTRLWHFRKAWAERLWKLNHEDNLRYLKTGKINLSDDLEKKGMHLDAIEKRARLGLYCTDPKVTSVSYLNFAMELGLVMMRRRDPDTCYRIYKYHVERSFPRMSWDEFKKQVMELQETHHVSFKDFQPDPQLLEGSSEEPASNIKISIRKRQVDSRWN